MASGGSILRYTQFLRNPEHAPEHALETRLNSLLSALGHLATDYHREPEVPLPRR